MQHNISFAGIGLLIERTQILQRLKTITEYKDTDNYIVSYKHNDNKMQVKTAIAVMTIEN